MPDPGPAPKAVAADRPPKPQADDPERRLREQAEAAERQLKELAEVPPEEPEQPPPSLVRPGKKGASAYDAFPEPWRARFVGAWERKVEEAKRRARAVVAEWDGKVETAKKELRAAEAWADRDRATDRPGDSRWWLWEARREQRLKAARQLVEDVSAGGTYYRAFERRKQGAERDVAQWEANDPPYFDSEKERREAEFAALPAAELERRNAVAERRRKAVEAKAELRRKADEARAELRRRAEEATPTADKLFAAYGKDLAAADGKYLGKVLEVSGVRGKVEKDARGRYFIGTYGQRFVKPPDWGQARVTSAAGARQAAQAAALSTVYVPAVTFYLEPGGLARFAGLDGTQAVTIRGTCRGSAPDPSTFPEYGVILEGCVRAD
jgi:hypothetical protein